MFCIVATAVSAFNMNFYLAYCMNNFVHLLVSSMFCRIDFCAKQDTMLL